jgi:hypothetical protein
MEFDFDINLTNKELVKVLIEREKELTLDLHIKNTREITYFIQKKPKPIQKIENLIRKFPRLTLFLIKINKFENYKQRILNQVKKFNRFSKFKP